MQTRLIIIFQLCLALTACIVALIATPLICVAVGVFDTEIPIQLIISSLIQLFIGVLFLWLIYRFVDKTPFLTVRSFQKKWLVDGTIGVILGIGGIILGTLFLVVTNSIELHYFNQRIDYLLAAMVAFCALASFEELFFRKYIVSHLLKLTKRPIAIIIGALLFALVHSVNIGMSFLGLFNIFLAGVLLTLMYLSTMNLWMPIGFHAFWNLSQSFLGYEVSASEMPSTFILTYNNPNLLNGGAVGFEGSIVCTLILSILCVVFLISKPQT